MVEIDNWLSVAYVRSISDLVHSEEVYVKKNNKKIYIKKGFSGGTAILGGQPPCRNPTGVPSPTGEEERKRERRRKERKKVRE